MKSKQPKKNTFQASTQSFDQLEKNVQDSQALTLPDQGAAFRHESSRHKRKAHNLPDFKILPQGYSPTKKFYELYPELHLPALNPADDSGRISFGSSEVPSNEIYLGDNLQVLRSLPSKFIDLIYIDPPFFSGRNYNLIWGDDNEFRTFGDIWEDGLPSYLEWLNARLWEMARTLKDTGSIYVHCDWHASHYIKTEMDKIFGYENFRNEIIWNYTGNQQPRDCFPKKHDVLLYYAKSNKTRINFLFEEYSEGTLRRYNHIDEEGRRYKLNRYGGKLVKAYMKKEGKRMPDVWNIPWVIPTSKEAIGYPTQKPVALLERIIKASSNEGEVVADFFMGGGTTPSVAQKQGRRFICCDVSNVAHDVSLSRLISGGEEQSGIQTNRSDAEALQGKLEVTKIPDISLKYVGIYPMQLFEGLDALTFKRHILTIVRARESGTQDGITGYSGPTEPILVGNTDLRNPIDPNDLKRFVQAVVTKHKPNVKILARVFAWSFPADVERYKNELQAAVDQMVRPQPLAIKLIPIESEEFRRHVLELYADVEDTALLLSFIRPPVIGQIETMKIKGREWKFEAKGARAWSTGVRLVNCQWDFDYQEGHFTADRGAILMREKEKDSFRAVLTVEYEFEEPGTKNVACKLQDSAGGECVEVVTIEVK